MRRNLNIIRSAVLSVAFVAGGWGPAARGDEVGAGFRYDTEATPPQVISSEAVAEEAVPLDAASPVDPAAMAYDNGGPAISVNAFYSDLAPYGRWVYVAGYGRCWIPAGVPAGWRPYTLGHWAWTDCGWTWVSDENWGWATYHYGRWCLDTAYGWVWVPGTTWAPAWVTWRCGDGFVGWAPLPPGDGWHRRHALFSLDVNIAPSCFTFVAERSFCEANIHRQILPVERNVTIINRTTNITNIEVVNNRVVNHGIDPGRIERDTGRRIEQVHMRDVSRPGDVRQSRGNEVAVYRPRVAPVATPVARSVATPAPAVRPAPAPATTVRRAPAATPAVRPAPMPTPSVRAIPAATAAVRPAPVATWAVRPAPAPTAAVRSAPVPTSAVRPAPAAVPPARSVRIAPAPAAAAAPARVSTAVPTARSARAGAPAGVVHPAPAAASSQVTTPTRAPAVSPRPAAAATAAATVRRAAPAPAATPMARSSVTAAPPAATHVSQSKAPIASHAAPAVSAASRMPAQTATPLVAQGGPAANRDAHSAAALHR